jgi:ferredoxin
MPRLTIDHRSIDVPAGATVLEAARRLGIEIPTLCYLEGLRPSSSCLVCMVKIRDRNRFVPSCATAAADGMEVESDTDEVRQARRTALELLLSDHAGDCLAPCHFACPCHMDIPLMLRQISAGQLGEAIATIKRDIALPAVLGRVCPKPCEKGCRRHAADGAVAVCQLQRYAADLDLASSEPYLPPAGSDSGKRVAIVGGGPTGLSAAFYLRQRGHACTLFEARGQLGGRLRTETAEDQLPRAVLDAEIAAVLRLGVTVRLDTPLGETRAAAGNWLDALLAEFHAVLLACGPAAKALASSGGLETAAHGVRVDPHTYAAGRPGVFAAGGAIHAKALVVRSVADGKEAARSIDRYLNTGSVAAPAKPFSSRLGRLEVGQLDALVTLAGGEPRQEPAGEFLPDQAAQQAGRCLHCDCRGLATCKLRRYAAEYGADPARYRGERHPSIRVAHSAVIYESGKCIDCGLCIQIAERAQEPLGLAFVGRGFDVRIGVPFDRTMEEALGRVAAECVAACPTAALAFRKGAGD